MIKVVLDANVLVSGLLWEGIPNRLLTLIKQGKVTLHLSLEIVEELEAVLKRSKFNERIQELETDVDELLSSLLALAEIYSVGGTIDVIKEDPDDNMFIACALHSGAEYIVSGDKHLLDLRSYHGIKIVSPKEFFDKSSDRGILETEGMLQAIMPKLIKQVGNCQEEKTICLVITKSTLSLDGRGLKFLSKSRQNLLTPPR